MNEIPASISEPSGATLTEGGDAPLDGDVESLQFLTFRVMKEEYGVDIMTVREIKGWTKATRLPNAPEYMRGVINLRGSIIPIFDLRTRFSGEVTQVGDHHVFIIIAVGERNIGILVDAVSDILTVRTNEIKPPPEMDSLSQSDFIKGLISLEKRMVVILDVEHLFNEEDIELVDQMD